MKEIYRVLIVEDDEVLAKVIDDVTKESFVVEWVDTLAKAIDRLVAFGQAKLDAALVDLTLPNGKGLDVVSKLRKVAPDLPLVVYTGGDITRTAAIAAGADDLLQKPAMADEIIDAVINVIATRSVEKELAPLENAIDEQILGRGK